MDKKQALEISKGLNTQANKPTCPNCGSREIRARVKDSFCRVCGHVWERKP